MAWDDFLATVQDDSQSVSDIYSHITDTKANVDQSLVSIGLQPTGNLSAQDLVNGLRGTPAPQAASSPQAANAVKSTAFGFNSLSSFKLSGPVLVIAIAAAFFLLKKGRK